MSVYPERRKGRLTGTWIGETSVNGTKVRKRFPTKHEGDVWEGFMTLAPGALPELEKPQGPTFGEVAKEMLAAKPKAADPAGLDRLMFVIDYIGDGTPIANVTTPMLDKLVALLRARKGKQSEALSASTINRYLSEVSGVMSFAEARKYPAVYPVIPWIKTDSFRLEWLSEAQEAAVIGFMEADGSEGGKRCALLVKVLTATGMRWGELASLTPEQIEPETGWVRLWKTKNGTSRSAPVPKPLAVELKALVVNKTMPSYYTFRKCLKDASKSAGLSPQFCIHSLRHTTATRLLQKGVPLAIVKKYLGHKTIQTTLKYTHVADDDLQNALEKLSQRAGQTEGSPILLSENSRQIKADVAELVDASDLKSV